MSDLIRTVQLQEIGESLVSLFQLKIVGTSTIIYAYSGLEDGTTTISFPDIEPPHTLRTYVALPMEVTGIEWTSDGPSNRPSLSIANIISYIASSAETTLGDELRNLNIKYNEDLLGSQITVRRTLSKYLNIPGPPIEFPVMSFFLDRITVEDNSYVQFELASPFDVEGVKIPGRIVVGRYCGWDYRGVSMGKGGGCTWSGSSPYLDENNNPTTQANDRCGKTLASCKARFHASGNRAVSLPFGGFPGVRAF